MLTVKTSLKAGFTLVELSIVLVIIGFLIGGVMVGKDLIASSEMRATIRQFDELNAATLAFKLKYNCLPGDCPDAAAYFTLPGCTSPGNGDGKILNGSNPYPDNWTGEPMGYYNELKLSNLYPAGFLNSACSIGNGGVIGVNIIPAKMGSGGFITTSIAGKNGHFWGIQRNFDISLYSGYQAGIFTLSNETKGLITPAQAYNFDQKIDDGTPATGKVVTALLLGGDNRIHQIAYTGVSNCTLNTSPVTYNTSYSSSNPNVCNLFLYAPF